MSVAKIQRNMEDVAVRLNVTDLIFKVIREVAGNDISTTINNSKVTKQMITSLIENKLTSQVNSNNDTPDGYSDYYAAKSGTLLDSLVKASIPLVSEVSTNDNSYSYYDVIKNNIEAMAQVNGQQNVLMAECVKVLATAVTNHIKIAKTEVLPKVKDLVDVFDNIKNNGGSSYSDPLSSSKIVVYDKPVLASNNDIAEILDQYKDYELIVPNKRLNLEATSAEKVILGCTTGDSSLDEDIIEYLNSIPVSVVTDAFVTFFSDSTNYVERDDILKLNGYERFSYGLVGYLTARRLLDNIPDGVNMSMKDYNSVVADIMNFSGGLMSTGVDMIDGYYRTQTLLLNKAGFAYSPVVKVCGEVYREWIKDNSEELVIASSVSDRPRYTISSIEAHKEEIMNEWNSFCTLYKINSERRHIDEIKATLVSYAYTDTLTDFEKEYAADNKDYLSIVKQNADSYVNSLSGSDLENLDNVCLHLIAKCRYYFTSAYVILSAMNEAYKLNSELEPREAALLSIIDYLASYMSSQVTVNRDRNTLYSDYVTNDTADAKIANLEDADNTNENIVVSEEA